ncbi:MAG: amidinotransferase, partial [Thaumarchaeota archaeon]|nr:amidinotransferase [Nitrososphaerota archaeon]
YISLLKAAGIKVIELKPLEEFPDSIFVQDPGILGSSRSVIARFGELSRRGEAEVFANDLKAIDSERIGEIGFIEEPGTLEGGDVLITPHGLFAGESGRSNMIGIDQLARVLKGITVIPVSTQLKHLLGACTYLSNRTILVAPELVNPLSFPGFSFVNVPTEESYAANVLYLGDKKVLMPSGFPRSRSKLIQAGYEPEEVNLSRFQKGDGSVTCLCSPVYKGIF